MQLSTAGGVAYHRGGGQKVSSRAASVVLTIFNYTKRPTVTKINYRLGEELTRAGVNKRFLLHTYIYRRRNARHVKKKKRKMKTEWNLRANEYPFFFFYTLFVVRRRRPVSVESFAN